MVHGWGKVWLTFRFREEGGGLDFSYQNQRLQKLEPPSFKKGPSKAFCTIERLGFRGPGQTLDTEQRRRAKQLPFLDWRRSDILADSDASTEEQKRNNTFTVPCTLYLKHAP